MSVLNEVKSYKGVSARGSQTDTLTSVTSNVVAVNVSDELRTLEYKADPAAVKSSPDDLVSEFLPTRK
jgi:hypothetical protein